MLRLLFSLIFGKRKKEKGSHIREFVFGFNDGLVTTFTVVASFTGAQISNLLIVFASLVNAFSDGLSMALGAWLSTKNEIESVKNYKEKVIASIKSKEGKKEVEDKLRSYFYSLNLEEKEVSKLIDSLFQDHNKLADFMAKNIENISTPEVHTPFKDAVVMFFSFLLGSLFPVFPYLFPFLPNKFVISVTLVLLSAFIIGILKTKITGRNKLKSGIESLVIAFLLLLFSYSLGILFRMVTS